MLEQSTNSEATPTRMTGKRNSVVDEATAAQDEDVMRQNRRRVKTTKGIVDRATEERVQRILREEHLATSITSSVDDLVGDVEDARRRLDEALSSASASPVRSPLTDARLAASARSFAAASAGSSDATPLPEAPVAVVSTPPGAQRKKKRCKRCGDVLLDVSHEALSAHRVECLRRALKELEPPVVSPPRVVASATGKAEPSFVRSTAAWASRLEKSSPEPTGFYIPPLTPLKAPNASGAHRECYSRATSGALQKHDEKISHTLRRVFQGSPSGASPSPQLLNTRALAMLPPVRSPSPGLHGTAAGHGAPPVSGAVLFAAANAPVTCSDCEKTLPAGLLEGHVAACPVVGGRRRLKRLQELLGDGPADERLVRLLGEPAARGEEAARMVRALLSTVPPLARLDPPLASAISTVPTEAARVRSVKKDAFVPRLRERLAAIEAAVEAWLADPQREVPAARTTLVTAPARKAKRASAGTILRCTALSQTHHADTQ